MTTARGLLFPKDHLCECDYGDHGCPKVQTGMASCRLCNIEICLKLGRCCAKASDIKNINCH